MRQAVLSLASLAISTFAFSNHACAQSGVIREDLIQCRNEIVQFQQAASQYFRMSATNCSSDPQSDCGAGWIKTANEVAAEEPISFYWKGSDHCEGGSYTCFGEGSFKFLTDNPEYIESLLTRAPEPPLKDEGGGYASISSDVADQCIFRARQKRLEQASAPVAAAPANDTPVAASPGNGSASPPGTKRRHVPDAIAAHCLTPKTDSSGVTNGCNFAVEYIYCVVNPKEGSWSSSFDCAQAKTGSWQVGPLSESIMHTDGDEVQFFACKYGPTISQPDGISPTDFHFNGYRQAPTGRCAEWGSK